jgi:hypothetical protein
VQDITFEELGMMLVPPFTTSPMQVEHVLCGQASKTAAAISINPESLAQREIPARH